MHHGVDDPLKNEVLMLAGKVQMLVNFIEMSGVLRDGSFTFPDGDTWVADKMESQVCRLCRGQRWFFWPKSEDGVERYESCGQCNGWGIVLRKSDVALKEEK